MAEDESKKRPIIIRVQRPRGGPSVTWKPAPSYLAAAMIPLFLLAWLVATASPQAKQALVGYFKQLPQTVVVEEGVRK